MLEARGHVDEVAVDRACGGQHIRLTYGERKAAIDRLTAQGYTAELIADRIGLSERTVQRYRAGGYHKSLRLRPPDDK